MISDKLQLLNWKPYILKRVSNPQYFPGCWSETFKQYLRNLKNLTLSKPQEKEKMNNIIFCLMSSKLKREKQFYVIISYYKIVMDYTDRHSVSVLFDYTLTWCSCTVIVDYIEMCPHSHWLYSTSTNYFIFKIKKLWQK